MKTIIFILIFAFSIFAQNSHSWKGLVIDEATPEKAIEVLGKADEDKTDSFRVYKIDEWVTKEIREKKYRRLEYKTVEGFEKVILCFKENKLVFIELNPKKLSPNVLAKSYEVPFKPVFSKFDQSLNRRDFERDNGDLKAKKYPSFYYLVAVAEKTFLLASVSNTSIGSLLGSKSNNDDLDLPGKVAQFQIISRTLENKEGQNLLK